MLGHSTGEETDTKKRQAEALQEGSMSGLKKKNRLDFEVSDDFVSELYTKLVVVAS